MLNPKLVASRPEDVGIDSDRLEAVFARAKRDVDEGVLPSAQVAIARHGKLADVRTYGSAVQGNEERSVTDETLYTIFSSTKAVMAVAVWILFRVRDER
jgi:CubicO group peptidase (beta-lactamase class C family)